MSTKTGAAAKGEVFSKIAPKKPGLSQKILWEEFEKEYLTREDEFKYEWLDGHVQQSKRAMNKYQLYILKNLQDLFISLIVAKKVTGNLIAEADLFFLKKHRRPDVCWLTPNQFTSLANGNDDVPAFVIEIVSTNDTQDSINDKMNDYRAAHVQVAWLIFPSSKQVHIYEGRNLKKISVLMGDEICSARPALPEYELSVSQIFKK